MDAVTLEDLLREVGLGAAAFARRFPNSVIVTPPVEGLAVKPRVVDYVTLDLRVDRKNLIPSERDKQLAVPVRKKTGPGGLNVYIWVGRDPTCDVVLPFSTVSKVHFRVYESDAGLQIADMGSKNGTKLNGVALVKDRPVPLEPGAQIGISTLTFRFLSPELVFQELTRLPKAR